MYLSPSAIQSRKLWLRTLEFLKSSITRRSYGEKPTTSLTTERTNFVFWDWIPLRCEGLTVFGMAVVGWPWLGPRRRSGHSLSLYIDNTISIYAPLRAISVFLEGVLSGTSRAVQTIANISRRAEDKAWELQVT